MHLNLNCNDKKHINTAEEKLALCYTLSTFQALCGMCRLNCYLVDFPLYCDWQILFSLLGVYFLKQY